MTAIRGHDLSYGWVIQADGPPQRVNAEVAWVHPDRSRDAALLRVDSEEVTEVMPVRWGSLVGTEPMPYTGLGYPEFADYESGRGAEQLDGTLPPLGLGPQETYILNQNSAPSITAGRPRSVGSRDRRCSVMAC